MDLPHITRVVLALLCISIACSPDETPQSELPIKPIKYGVVQISGGQVTRTFNGITRSGSETNLSFRTGGLISKMNISVGQRVKKGQLLVQLDQKDVLLALDQAKLDAQNAQVQLETATSSFERTKQLYQGSNASLSDYEKAKSTLSGAQSSYEIALKRLDLQRSQVTYTSLYAPMGGIVSAVNAELNEVVNPGQTIVVMSQEKDGDIEAQVGIPEKYINQIQQGDEVVVNVPSLQRTFEGFITEVGYSTSSGTYPVITSMNDLSSEIRPGMPVEISFSFGDEQQVKQITVPVKAVGEDDLGQFVYVLNKVDSGYYVASKTTIEVSNLTSNGFIVRTGLEEDNIVAVAGLRTLYDGMKVKLLNH
ncbi:MAG: efflux RND transporter periplasmic adaptor subunit [Flavobacteriales bacterium]|nr:efflux RND transporter periplasmic adaptor subunit [Flavobacteriales bacterium]